MEERPKVQKRNLEQFSEGLDEGEVQVLGQPPHIVMGLDSMAVLLPTAWRWTRLYYIWIQSSLQHIHAPWIGNMVSKVALCRIISSIKGHTVSGVMSTR